MKALLILLMSFLVLQASGQQKIASVKISENPQAAYVDRVGELFVMTDMGHIYRYGTDGTLLASHKHESPTLFDPRDGARLFAFFRDSRKVAYLSPTFEMTSTMIVDSAFVIDRWLVFASGDYNLWIVDAADGTLKKFNARESVILTETTLPDPGQAMKLKMGREYQGFVFLLDENKGIMVFNSMGRWIKTVGDQKISYFNFLGEDLYFPEGKNLKLINLFTGDERRIQVPAPFDHALVTDERMYLINGKTIDFFQFRP